MKHLSGNSGTSANQNEHLHMCSVNPSLRERLAEITAQPAERVQSSVLVHCSARLMCLQSMSKRKKARRKIY